MAGATNTCHTFSRGNRNLTRIGDTMIFLYKITVNGKFYIGQTDNMSRRMTAHRWHVRNNTNHPLYDAARKYEHLYVQVLNEAEDREGADVLERLYIKNYNTLSPNGYNLHPGGFDISTQTAEVRAKMSNAHKGKVLTAETRQRMTEAQNREGVKERKQRDNRLALERRIGMPIDAFKVRVTLMRRAGWTQQRIADIHSTGRMRVREHTITTPF